VGARHFNGCFFPGHPIVQPLDVAFYGHETKHGEKFWMTGSRPKEEICLCYQRCISQSPEETVPVYLSIWQSHLESGGRL